MARCLSVGWGLMEFQWISHKNAKAEKRVPVVMCSYDVTTSHFDALFVYFRCTLLAGEIGTPFKRKYIENIGLLSILYCNGVLN